MVFEVVRGYVQLASGLGELTRARATEVAQGLLSLPAAGVATGGQVAVQVGALAEELLAAALTNRQNLAALVRGEVDAAVTRLGLVPAEKLEESQAEAARLRAEVARLRSASSKTAAGTTAPKRTAATKTSPRATAKKAPAKKAPAQKATAVKAGVKKATAVKEAGTITSATSAAVGPRPAADAAKTAKTETSVTDSSQAAVISPGPAGA